MNKNIGDMNKEELYKLCNELLDKDTDYMLIQRKIDKAIEYIKYELIPYGNEWHWDDAGIKDYVEKLLEILGDEENAMLGYSGQFILGEDYVSSENKDKI